MLAPKIVRMADNFKKYLHDAMDFVCLMLEDHAPPLQPGRFRVRMSLHIEELGDHDEVVRSFTAEKTIVKTVSKWLN